MLGSRVRAPKGAQRTEIRNGLRFSYMLSSALPAIAVGSVVLFFHTHEVMLGRGRAHGLTILKPIYKNYKEKSSLYLLISLENMYLCRHKKKVTNSVLSMD